MSYHKTEKFIVENCILELVKISISKEASSIAVRFDPKKHKVQVVDNGNGFSKSDLDQILDPQQKKFKIIFNKTRFLSSNVILTSKHKHCTKTYVKILSATNEYEVFQGYNRPSKGTTVTIYNFNSSGWSSNQIMTRSISYVICAIAFTELKISFSLRNDDEKKIIVKIGKPHSPWEILKYMGAYNNCTMSYEPINAFMEKISENHEYKDKPDVDKQSAVSEPKEVLKDGEEVIKSCFTVTSQDIFSHLLNTQSTIQSSLSEWSNWSYNPNPVVIRENHQDHTNQDSSSNNPMVTFNDNFLNLSQLSVWSDWNYEPDDVTVNSHFSNNHLLKYLSPSINELLPYKHIKILGDRNLLQSSQCPMFDAFNEIETSSLIKIHKNLINITNIQEGKNEFELDQCTISKETINSFQILRQINNEFIVAIVNENHKKLLVIVDQHAVHERIRYEWLLDTYRNKESYEYNSVKLKKNLKVDVDEKYIETIKLHKKKFKRIGLNIKTIVDSTCIVDTVPQCFTKKIRNLNNESNLYRLLRNVRELLSEVAKGLSISRSVLPPILPTTINNVIASEACHGAIKFGDPLNSKECKLLIEALKDTNAPTRCAHGRPSIIPLLDLSGLKRRQSSVTKVLKNGPI